jgi:hypothetical protein
MFVSVAPMSLFACVVGTERYPLFVSCGSRSCGVCVCLSRAVERLDHETAAAVSALEACIRQQPYQLDIQLAYTDLVLGGIILGVPTAQRQSVV